MKKKINLKLDKEVITSLSNGELQQINGGSYFEQESKAPKCDTIWQCPGKYTLNCWESNSLCKPEDSDGCVEFSKVNCNPVPASKQCVPMSQGGCDIFTKFAC